MSPSHPIRKGSDTLLGVGDESCKLAFVTRDLSVLNCSSDDGFWSSHDLYRSDGSNADPAALARVERPRRAVSVARSEDQGGLPADVA